MTEFCAVWFPSKAAWFVLTDAPAVHGPFNSIGECCRAMVPLGYTEADWDHEERPESYLYFRTELDECNP